MVLGKEPVLAEVGQSLEIARFDRRLAATVTVEPLFDPQMSRMRLKPSPRHEKGSPQ